MSTHHTNDNEVQHLYEGDQSKLYSGLMGHHHGESIKGEGSRNQIRRIFKVTAILTVITIVEVGLGLLSSSMGMPKALINSFFLILTIFKAAYIVKVFMHLGDEMKNFLITVLIPLTLFIWFIIAFLADGSFWLHMNSDNKTRTQIHSTQSADVHQTPGQH
jgi:cytochrome c oxidase subunit IV